MHPMNEANDHMDDLLAKLLNGEATAEEKKEAENWLAADVARQQEFEALKKIWMYSGTPSPDFDTDSAWEKVSRKIGTAPKIIPIYRRKPFIYAAAAAIAILIAVPFVLPFLTGGPATDEVITLAASDKTELDTLPDGSAITRNSGTTLIAAGDFKNGKTRRVKLKGEAFFNVAHNAERPFIIETTNDVRIRVLGTSFNVLADNDTLTEITVVTGRVRVTQGNDSIVLVPGESGSYNRRTGLLLKNEAAGLNADAWKTNRLVFKDTELEKVVEVLNRFYRTNIRFDNEAIRQMRFTGTFENESLDNVLEVIEATFSIHAVRSNSQIHLKTDSIR